MKHNVARLLSLFALVIASLGVGVSGANAQDAALQPLRPPAVPLMTVDPYFSVWSFNDRLTDADTRHWTGKPHTMLSLVRIDGKPFREDPTKRPTTAPTTRP